MLGLFLTVIWGTRCALQHVLRIYEEFYSWSCCVGADLLTWVVCISLQEDSYKRQKKRHLNEAFWGNTTVQHQFEWKPVTARWRIDVSLETGNGPFPSSLCHCLFSLLHVYVSFGFFPFPPSSMWDVSVRNGGSWCKQTVNINTCCWARPSQLGR